MAGIIKVDRVQSDSNLAFNIAGANVAFMDASALRLVGSGIVANGTTIVSGSKVVAAAQPTGAVLQVLQAIKTDTFSSTSGSWTDVTGLSVAITPTSSSSKIMVFLTLAADGNTTTGSTGRLVRDSTAIGVADSASSRQLGGMAEFYTSRTDQFATHTSFVLDSPATTSSITYKAQVIVGGGGGTVSINRSYADTNSTSYTRGVSSITVMEIAG